MANDDSLRRDFADRDELRLYLQQLFPHAIGYDSGLSPTQGGAAAARQAMTVFRPARYAATRNYLSGSVSHLSAYLRHGVLTLTDVFQHFVASSTSFKTLYKFVQELAWRDYWQRIYFEIGDGVWADRERWKTGFSEDDYSNHIPADVLDATTDLACMDAFSRTLISDGYLHNHARMWFASYLIHWRRVKWQAGARWFLTHLIDGDPASNNLSWQWVASTFSSKTYIFNRENLERYTDGKYCAGCPHRMSCPFDKPYEVLSTELFRADSE